MEVEIFAGIAKYPNGRVSIEIFTDEEKRNQWAKTVDGKATVYGGKGIIEIDDAEICDYVCTNFGFIDPDNPPENCP